MFVVQEFVAPGERGVLLFGVIRSQVASKGKNFRIAATT
jgi:hypothetical protein